MPSGRVFRFRFPGPYMGLVRALLGLERALLGLEMALLGLEWAIRPLRVVHASPVRTYAGSEIGADSDTRCAYFLPRKGTG